MPASRDPPATPASASPRRRRMRFQAISYLSMLQVLRAPMLRRRQRHHCVHIDPRVGRDRHLIYMQTIDHRRNHRVDCRKIAEEGEKGAGLTELPAGLPKNLFEAADIDACLRGSARLIRPCDPCSSAAVPHRDHSLVERDAEMAHCLQKTPRAALKARETTRSSSRPAGRPKARPIHGRCNRA
jgi:hypothetical protein